MEYKIQVETVHYSFDKYVHQERWVSYWYQIKEVLDLGTDISVLDIGPGSSFMQNSISTFAPNITYKSVDIDTSLQPDFVGSVVNLPLEDASVDCVTAFQVLEHIQYSDVDTALSEIARVSKEYAIISLPHFGPQMTFGLKVPFVPKIEFAFKLPWPKKLIFNGQHYWEIGRKGHPLRKIRKSIKQHFVIEREYVPFQNQYHRFFVLKKA